MQPGLLAYGFRRRLIVDAFVRDIPRRRLRGALDNDTFDALVNGATSKEETEDENENASTDGYVQGLTASGLQHTRSISRCPASPQKLAARSEENSQPGDRTYLESTWC